MSELKKGRYYKYYKSNERAKFVGLGFAENKVFAYYIFDDGRYGNCRVHTFKERFILMDTFIDKLKKLFVPKD